MTPLDDLRPTAEEFQHLYRSMRVLAALSHEEAARPHNLATRVIFERAEAAYLRLAQKVERMAQTLPPRDDEFMPDQGDADRWCLEACSDDGFIPDLTEQRWLEARSDKAYTDIGLTRGTTCSYAVANYDKHEESAVQYSATTGKTTGVWSREMDLKVTVNGYQIIATPGTYALSIIPKHSRRS